MTISAVVIGICAVPWVVFGYAAHTKLRDIYFQHPNLPKPTSSTPLGYTSSIRSVRSKARAIGEDRAANDFSTVIRYRMAGHLLFTAMSSAFLYDFIRNVFFHAAS